MGVKMGNIFTKTEEVEIRNRLTGEKVCCKFSVTSKSDCKPFRTMENRGGELR